MSLTPNNNSIDTQMVPSEMDTTTQIDTQPKTPQGMKAKKAQTSYLHFINTKENRQTVTQDYEKNNPGLKLSPKHVVKELAKKWNSLTDDEKQPYQDLFLQEKARLADSPQWIPQKKKKEKRQPQGLEPTEISSLMDQNEELRQELQEMKEKQYHQQQQLTLLTQIIQKMSTSK